jgi:hypothetical protein
MQASMPLITFLGLLAAITPKCAHAQGAATISMLSIAK